MSAGLIGGLVLACALFYLAISIAYLVGAWRGARDLDDTFEIAKSLGAYGQLLRMEADAMGVTVEELVERDARLARGETP